MPVSTIMPYGELDIEILLGLYRHSLPGVFSTLNARGCSQWPAKSEKNCKVGIQ